MVGQILEMAIRQIPKMVVGLRDEISECDG